MSELWYFTSEGKKMEPVTAAELKQLAASGYLKPTDLVWKEGMAAWTKASAVPGLCPPAKPAAPIRSASSGAVPIRSRRAEVADDIDDIDDRPKRRRDEDDLDDRPKRPRTKESGGISGLMIGLIIGGCVLAVLLVIGVIVLIAIGSKSNHVANYSVDLAPDRFESRPFTFNSGVLYEITVKSDQQTDVDLHICDMNNNRLCSDISIGPDSRVQWSPAVSGQYRVMVANLDKVRGNRSHVNIQKLGKANGPVAQVFAEQPQFLPPQQQPAIPRPVQPPVVIPQPKPPQPRPPVPNLPVNKKLISDPAVMIPAGGTYEKMVTYPKSKLVEMRVESDDPQNDIDLFVFEKERRVAADALVSHNCRVTFGVFANRTYRIEVKNLGPNPAQCTLSYTEP